MLHVYEVNQGLQHWTLTMETLDMIQMILAIKFKENILEPSIIVNIYLNVQNIFY